MPVEGRLRGGLVDEEGGAKPGVDVDVDVGGAAPGAPAGGGKEAVEEKRVMGVDELGGGPAGDFGGDVGSRLTAAARTPVAVAGVVAVVALEAMVIPVPMGCWRRWFRFGRE